MTAATRIDPVALDKEILRGSVKSRCHQAGMAFVAMILNTGFCVLLLGRGVSGLALATWLLSLTGLLLIRYVIAMRAARSLDASRAELEKFDRQFRLLSLASQFATGAGIWIVWEAHDEISSYVMTLLICLYATGTMVNLAHDYRSFRLTIPVLMLQPTLFWLLAGIDGIAIAVILPGLTFLMISSVRNSQRSFDKSIKIRFEKDDLLQQLEREKETALAALRQAEIANRSKSFFMAAASHDLRQPLYAASILCDTLALHKLPAEAAKLLEQQRRALAAASGLFDNLLDLSRFESGTIAPTVTSVNLRDLLKQIEAEFSSLCAAKGIGLSIEADEHAVSSDYDLLDRMVRNLVSNAVRYTTRGGVRIATEMNGEAVLLVVEDTGIGIAAGDQQRIFQEFVQLDNPQRSRDKGVGLGLAIVHHISLLLMHEVAVESAPGQGTRISVLLPRANSSTPALPSASSPHVPELDLTGRQVWIIEDDTSVRDALDAYFRQRQCSCATVGSSRELDELERMTTRLPDFVLIDDMLSCGESGLEVARWLARRIAPQQILLMTGNVNPERLQQLLASGFAVMRKPVFASALNNWLSCREELLRMWNSLAAAPQAAKSTPSPVPSI